jgi:hypothetical protein
VRLVDVDGSGTTDIVYLGRSSTRYWINRSGNSFAAAVELKALPVGDSVSSVAAFDLLGKGTACLVMSRPLGTGRGQQVRYVDLLEGTKPYLMTAIDNHLGAETTITYAPSTKFYLEDRAAGRPWATKLPFPVQVIEQVVHHDIVSDTTLTTSYKYHHGYWDPVEKEFRGFAMVEQRDAEVLLDEHGSGEFTDPDHVLDVPPVVTKTWLHTGAWREGERLEAQYESEYYDGDVEAVHLPRSSVPAGLAVQEVREALRALRGRTLRTEVYAEDGTGTPEHPP